MPRESDGDKLTITIEFRDFLTRFDLDEILGGIDRVIERTLSFSFPEMERRTRLLAFFNRLVWSPQEPALSYIGIQAVKPGSLTLLAFIGGAVVSYVAHRFSKGVDSSILGKELERSGQLVGDTIGPLVMMINNWGEDFVNYQKNLGGNVQRIIAERGHRSGHDPGITRPKEK